MLALVASMGETIVAALAGLVGVLLGGWVSVHTTNRQLKAQKEKDALEKRDAERGTARLLGAFLEESLSTVALMLSLGHWYPMRTSPADLPTEYRRELLNRVGKFEAVVAAEVRAKLVFDTAAQTHGRLDDDPAKSSRTFLEESYRIIRHGVLALADPAESAEWALIPDDHADYMTYVGERGVREFRAG